jgi:hypothetical protein
MKAIYRYLVFIVIACLLSSCGKKTATPGANVQYFIPGECLESAELRPVPEFDDLSRRVVQNRLEFVFLFDLSNVTTEYINNSTSRVIPSDKLFDNFGANSKAVKEIYESAYADCMNLFPKINWLSISTILYDGGISLIADKDFAGIPANEELAPLIMGLPMNDEYIEQFGKDAVLAPGTHLHENIDNALGIPLDYFTALEGDLLSFSIPMGDYEIVEENITFELKVPVKVVKYLTWLNDRLTDPEAEVPYEEKILHCRFTSKYGLR